MPLYHYTCPHGNEAILNDGGLIRSAIEVMTTRQHRKLRAMHAVSMVSQVVWLTTLEHVTPFNVNQCGLGMARMAELTGQKQCDRTQHRWEITEENVTIFPWTYVRDAWPTTVVQDLESLPGARFDTWWLSRGPLHARYSPHRKAVLPRGDDGYSDRSLASKEHSA